MLRVPHRELLDDDSPSPREVAAALRSMAWVNRLFGGSRMHARLLRRVAQKAAKHDLHILEVACGHATALQFAGVRLLPSTSGLRLTLLDRSALHFPSVGQWNRKLPQPTRLTADALTVPLADNSVDVVSCCLFLHHLAPPEVAEFLAESLRLARVAVVINDLERSRMHFALAKLFSFVDPSLLSRHDGPVSVRQAYTAAELEPMLRTTGHRFELMRGYLFRLGAILWK